MKFSTLVTSTALATMMIAGSAMAQDTPAPIEPISLGDNRLSCDALVVEAKAMQTILGGAPEGGIFGSERAMEVGTSLAMEGAIRSGLGGRAAGAVGFLGRAAKAAGKRKAEAEAARRQSALRRWYYVVGLYQGKDCDHQPVAAPAVSSTTPVDQAPVTTTGE
jgi:hypothetical protein